MDSGCKIPPTSYQIASRRMEVGLPTPRRPLRENVAQDANIMNSMMREPETGPAKPSEKEWNVSFENLGEPRARPTPERETSLM